MKSRTNRTAAFVTAALFLSGCSASSKSHDGSHVNSITASGVTREYRAEQASLTLAPGHSWPADPTPKSVADDGRKIVFQPGYGTTRADLFWFCTWEHQFVDPANSDAEHYSALQTMLTVHGTYFYKNSLAPADKAFFDGILDAAGLGDNSKVQNNLRNCTPESK